MSERTNETGDAPRDVLREPDAMDAEGRNGDDAINPADRAPDPDEELAQAAAESAPYSTLTPPPVPRPSRAARRVWLAVVAAAVVLGVAFGPRFVRRAGELRTQGAAAEYASPGTLLVYEEQPEKAAVLLSNGASYLAVPLPEGGGGPPIAGHVPAVWREMRRWTFPRSPQPPGALLFLHERQTALGVRGIVAVEADRAGRRLRASFIHRGTYTSTPTAVTNVSIKPPPNEGMIVLSAGRDPFESKLPADDDGDDGDDDDRRSGPAARADLRFFAGQPDADDWTHFVIPYELDGYAGELAMWVADESTLHYLDRRFAR